MDRIYFKNLEKACKKLENIKDYKNNKINVFKFVLPIIQSFSDIRKTTHDEEILNNSLSLIINIKEKKPNLKGIVDAILDIINQPTIINTKNMRRWSMYEFTQKEIRKNFLPRYQSSYRLFF